MAYARNLIEKIQADWRWMALCYLVIVTGFLIAYPSESLTLRISTASRIFAYFLIGGYFIMLYSDKDFLTRISLGSAVALILYGLIPYLINFIGLELLDKPLIVFGSVIAIGLALLFLSERT